MQEREGQTGGNLTPEEIKIMKGTEEKLIGRNSQIQISERSGKLFHSENKKQENAVKEKKTGEQKRIC